MAYHSTSGTAANTADFLVRLKDFLVGTVGWTRPSRLDSHKRSCVVDAATEVGRAIARIFTGFLTREFGEEAFKVERVGDGPVIGPELKATGAA